MSAHVFPKNPQTSILFVIPLLVAVVSWYGRTALKLELTPNNVLEINILTLLGTLSLLVMGISLVYWLAQRLRAPLYAFFTGLHLGITTLALVVLVIGLEEINLTTEPFLQQNWLRAVYSSLILLQLAQALFLLNIMLGFLKQFRIRPRRS